MDMSDVGRTEKEMLKVMMVGTEVVGILKDVAEMNRQQFLNKLKAEFSSEEWEEIKSGYMGEVGELVNDKFIREYELEVAEISFEEYVKDIRLVYFAEAE